MQSQKEFFHDVWPEVFASRQNRTILKWPVTGVEEVNLRSGENGENSKKIPCLVVSKERVKGLIPLQEAGIKIDEKKTVNRARMIKYLGQDVAFVVIGIDRERDLFIASRRAALEQLKARTWPNLQEGMVVKAVARKIYNNNVVVEFDGIEANLPVWEISHGWVDEIFDIIQPGDEFDVKIIELDSENEKVTVSIKALIPNPWPDAAKRYQKRGVYQGTVTGVTRYGVFVALEPGVNALCKHLRTNKYQVQKGDIVAIQVIRINPDEGKINGQVMRLIRRNKSA